MLEDLKKNLLKKEHSYFTLCAFFCLFFCGYAWGDSATAIDTRMQAEIILQPESALKDQPEAIQPGKMVKIKLTVQNKGSSNSPAGEAWVQYAFAKPLDTQKESILFQTEKVQIEALQPGQKIEIDFKTPQQLPSLFDFIRNDWMMREYQAVVSFNHDQTIIGAMPLTFSAYYYPGVNRGAPATSGRP